MRLTLFIIFNPFLAAGQNWPNCFHPFGLTERLVYHFISLNALYAAATFPSMVVPVWA